MNSVIKVNNLTKVYKLYNEPFDRFKESLNPFKKSYHNKFYALDKVSFDVKRGETVGIVGKNGSGKSTLLKIITGVLTQTSGDVSVNGKISSLLELGAGFNPEYTGIENIFLQGTIMGYSRDEMSAKIDEILAFADIGDFAERSVGSYSSGMFVRLAFSVAINTLPQILIVDEVLSVGDELFQRKCISKINDLKSSGVAILFVSHSESQVIELCDTAILLHEGEMLAKGRPKKIIGAYQKLLYSPKEKKEEVLDSVRDFVAGSYEDLKLEEEASDEKCPLSVYDVSLIPSSTINYENNGAHIENVVILDQKGRKVNQLVTGGIYTYSYDVKFIEKINNVKFGMLIKTISGVELGGASSCSSMNKAVKLIEAGEVYNAKFEFKCNLNAGVYFMNAGIIALLNGEEKFVHRILDAVAFRVLPESEILTSGFVNFNCTNNITRI